MTADDLTKMLLSNKFKEFIKLIRISKIETDNDSKTSNSDKNNENFVINYYKKTDKEVSFETEKAE